MPDYLSILTNNPKILSLIGFICQEAEELKCETVLHDAEFYDEKLKEWEGYETETLEYNLSRNVKEENVDTLKEILTNIRSEQADHLKDIDWSRF